MIQSQKKESIGSKGNKPSTFEVLFMKYHYDLNLQSLFHSWSTMNFPSPLSVIAKHLSMSIARNSFSLEGLQPL